MRRRWIVMSVLCRCVREQTRPLTLAILIASGSAGPILGLHFSYSRYTVNYIICQSCPCDQQRKRFSMRQIQIGTYSKRTWRGISTRFVRDLFGHNPEANGARIIAFTQTGSRFCDCVLRLKHSRAKMCRINEMISQVNIVDFKFGSSVRIYKLDSHKSGWTNVCLSLYLIVVLFFLSKK